MYTIIRSPSHDPYLNVAAEKYLFDIYHGEEILYFWVNGACAVIGKNQDPVLECDLSYMKAHGVQLVRRYTGGGAVYQDTGNLNYTYIGEEKDPGVLTGLLIQALAKLGIQAEVSGRNDLLVQGRKFSGMASMTDDGVYMRHGTLMLDVDIEQMTKVLHPSPLKIHSHGIASVRSRVINLSEIRDITEEDLIRAVRDILPQYRIAEFPGNVPEVLRMRGFLMSEAWLRDESPGYDELLEYRTPQALYRIAVQVSRQKIRSIRVFSDALEDEDTEAFCTEMIGRNYDPQMIMISLQKYLETLTFHPRIVVQ